MVYLIQYGEKVVKDDIPGIAKTHKERIRKAIGEKLTKGPELFGKPLRKSLIGFRKLRVGDYRVIFEIDGENVIIWAIGHRRDIYDIATKRL